MLLSIYGTACKTHGALQGLDRVWGMNLLLLLASIYIHPCCEHSEISCPFNMKVEGFMISQVIPQYPALYALSSIYIFT